MYIVIYEPPLPFKYFFLFMYVDVYSQRIPSKNRGLCPPVTVMCPPSIQHKMLWLPECKRQNLVISFYREWNESYVDCYLMNHQREFDASFTNDDGDHRGRNNMHAHKGNPRLEVISDVIAARYAPKYTSLRWFQAKKQQKQKKPLPQERLYWNSYKF